MEQRERDLRRHEFEREDIVKRLAKDTTFSSYLECEEKVDERRRLRGLKERALEEETFLGLVQAAKEKEELSARREKEEALVHQLDLLRAQQVREQKLRQSIRENSTELRELEKKLNLAYMNKQRALQLQEKALQQEYNKVHEAELVVEQKRIEAKAQAQDEANLQAAYQRTIDYQQALEQQLQELEERKEEELRIFLRDKAVVDEVVRRIQEEDDAAARARLEKGEETKKYIQLFLQEREAWKKAEAVRKAAEDAQIVEFLRLQQAREQQLQGTKAAADHTRNAIYDKLAREMEAREQAKDELEFLRIELAAEEQKEAARHKDQELLQSRIRKRLELIDAYRQQVEDKKRRLEREGLEEAAFRAKMMEKFAADENLEQMNQQRRRMKQLEHKRAVDQLLVEKQALEAERLRLLAAETQRQQELDAFRAEVIEQERQRLLREHAAGLLGYLPKGVLRDQKDLELFDEEFRKKFGDLKV